MNTFSLPFKPIATILAISVLVVIGVVNLHDRASWVEPWDGVFWVETRAGLRAEEVDARSPAALAGIRPGDRLLAINGREIRNLGEYSQAIDRIGANAAASYRLVSAGQGRDTYVTLAVRSMISAKDFPRTLLAFLHLAIGMFLVLRGGRQPRAFHFFLICLAAFVVYLYSYTSRLSAFDWTVYGISIAAFLFLPALFVHFCIRFPVEPDTGRSRAPLLYLPVVLLGLLQILWMSGRMAGMGLPRTAWASQVIDRIHLAYFVLGFMIGGSILFYRRVSARDLTTRQQMKWVSYGTLAGIIPFSLIYAIPELFGVRAGLAMYMSELFLGLIPLSFAYAIIRYRLLDVEVIFRRGAAYILSSSLLLALYILFALALQHGLQRMAPEADFIVIAVAALVIALLFAPLRDRIQTRLDRFFYRDQFDDRASLMEFAQTLTTEISLPRLSRSILERVARTFGLERAALFFADAAHPGFYRLIDAMGVPMPVWGQVLYRDEDLVEGDGGSGVADSSGAVRLMRPAAALQKSGLANMQELVPHGRRRGFIALGPPPPERYWTTEDLELLSALAGYAAIALENAHLYRSMETKALELERLKVYTENIIESINVAVLALDTGGRITSCNRAFEDLYGVKREDISGSTAEALFSPDVVASICRATGTYGWEIQSAGSIYKMSLETCRGERLIVNLSIV
ncbi:MAG: PAS domain-containing protein, partial [Acidobacteria bacterium]|nr:PAS domain-containing protein [Acidobacteriota bacterium]